MLNVAGQRYDFGAVLHAVLEDCEHRRPAFTGADAADQIARAAAEKLEAIELGHREMGGSAGYWRQLRNEVMGTAIPQYVPAAIRQTELEQSGYGLWREGDLLARALFALAGLTVGGIVIALPFIPIVERSFAFALAVCGWIYPELCKLVADRRHARLLNSLLDEAEKYQATQLRYLSDAALEEVLAEPAPEPRRGRREAAPGDAARRPAEPRRVPTDG